MITGYQAVYDKDFFDAIDYAAENDFDYVSYDLNVPRFYIDRLETGELERVRKHAEDAGVGLAFHTPGDNISLFSDYPAIRRGVLEHFSAIISASERLNARHVVIHSGIYPSLKKVNTREDEFSSEYREYFSTVLYDNLMHLTEYAKSVMLCIENFNLTDLTMAVIERTLANTDRLFLTWDIAKTYDINIQRNDAVEEFMWKHRDRIREIHAHDIIRGYRSHQTVGDGEIDFMPYAELLVRPDVAVTFEVRPREAARISRDRLAAMIG